ncbi:MAG: CoA transferase [SAR202 cluster bacterium]|nr:CoA transferase [SAR202 cluster bacterium]
MKHPLDGVTVVDLTSYIAGSYVATLLADLGARVVKVESPTGDGFRVMAGSFQGWNRGKRAIIVDLTKQEGRDLLYRMVAEADVVLENYRPGVAKKLGVDHETIRAITPDIVYCSVTAYGQTGPYIQSPGFDPLMQAQSGAMHAQGGEGNPPVFLRVAITDYAAAILGAVGIAAALANRARTGLGQRLETSLVNSAIAVQAAEFLDYGAKPEPRRMGDYGVDAAYRLYQASDGWLFLSCQDDESWAKACAALDRPELARRYPDMTSRLKHDGEIAAELERLFARGERQKWLNKLQQAGVRCGPSRVMTDFHDDSWAVQSGLTVSAESPDAGPVRQMGVAIGFSDTPGVVWRPAPSHGQHTDEVLGEIGYSDKDIARLRQNGVVG